MNTRYPGIRWGILPRTIASLFIGISFIVSSCSQPPQAIVTPNQIVSNTTQPVPVPVPVATPNNTTTPQTPAPNFTQTLPPAPNITVNTTPPPLPIPVPNTTQNTTPPPATPNTTPNTTPNATPNETQVLVSYKTVQSRFNMFCTSPECHDGTGNTSLSLLPAVSYKSLVNVASDFLTDKMRVKPGAPAQSVIMIMIDDPEHATVPQSVIDTVKQWILEGALNN